MTAADRYEQQFKELHARLTLDELTLIRKAFQDHGYPDDDAIRKVAHRVVEQVHAGGGKTWTLDGAAILRVGPPEFSEREEAGRSIVTFTRSVAFS